MRINIQTMDVPIDITVIPLKEYAELKDKKVLKIYDKNDLDKQATVIARIEISAGKVIEYFLENYPTGLADLTLHYIPETSTLLIGGKSISCAVDMKTFQVNNGFNHTLFWDFSADIHKGYILETGELDCLFRDLEGKVINKVYVEPPWEMKMEKNGVRFTFDSPVSKDSFLPFPDDKEGGYNAS